MFYSVSACCIANNTCIKKFAFMHIGEYIYTDDTGRNFMIYVFIKLCMFSLQIDENVFRNFTYQLLATSFCQSY